MVSVCVHLCIIKSIYFQSPFVIYMPNFLPIQSLPIPTPLSPCPLSHNFFFKKRKKSVSLPEQPRSVCISITADFLNLISGPNQRKVHKKQSANHEPYYQLGTSRKALHLLNAAGHYRQQLFAQVWAAQSVFTQRLKLNAPFLDQGFLRQHLLMKSQVAS